MRKSKEILIPITLENMQLFMNLNGAIQRACPFCAAKPGRGCTTLGGRKRKALHKQRFQP